MPIVKVEVCGWDDRDLRAGLAGAIRDAFAASFGADPKFVDVRVAAAPNARFAGFYERGDEPVWVDALMRALPPLPKRRDAIRAFSVALARLVGRDPSTIVLNLFEAPAERLAFGGTLLADMDAAKKPRPPATKKTRTPRTARRRSK